MKICTAFISSDTSENSKRLRLQQQSPLSSIYSLSCFKMATVGNRRPLDLNMSDGETEDEDKPRQAPKSTDELIAEADELIVKKKARHTKPFTEDVLTHPDGLQRIYEEFPVACKFRGRGSEAKDIKKLMAMYREWAFQLHPALAFSDIISKCESLGSKGKTRYFIQNLRDRERSRYIVRNISVPIFKCLM